MKKTVCVALALSLALLCGCGSGKKTAPNRAEVTSEERQFTAPADGDLIAIFTTNLGEVRVVLYPDAAPMAVYNFVGLARTGYYDGTTIWRSQYGFAVQGGDATGTGTGGSTIWSNNPYPLEADASLKHYAGALCAAFATGGDPITVVNTLSDFIFSAIKAIGIIILGWGIVQVGMSIQSHDASQRSQGFLCLFGGLVIAFAKEILSAIGAV